MLDPRDRTLLLEALKPPVGYSFDHAIGTTFSLDLIALLCAPLAFSLLDRTNREGQVVTDPAALLTALRRNADRIAIFCQVGGVRLPRGNPKLVTLLEKCVFEVAAPAQGGIFHPKLWVIRFSRDGAPVRYRVICSSRNLTFDKSWDTLLVLEGELRDRKNAYARNHPLADFVSDLPQLVTRGVTDSVREQSTLFANELRRVDFVVPVPFEGFEFQPIGIQGYKDNPITIDEFEELLVVSPFVSASLVDTLRKGALAKKGKLHLIARTEELSAVGAATLSRCASVHAFSDMTPEDSELASDEHVEKSEQLSGLHAKLYIADLGWNSTVWCGSANATSAAFTRNVEFLVRLIGKKSKVGIKAFLNEDEPLGFHAFLEPFRPEDIDPAEAERIELEQLASEVARAIAAAAWKLNVDGADDAWDLVLTLESKFVVPSGITVTAKAWPITTNGSTAARAMDFSRARGAMAIFNGVPMSSVTSFVAFAVDVERAGRFAPTQVFVLNLPVIGMPAARDAAVVSSLLTNAADVARYIMLLAQGIDQIGPGKGEWVISDKPADEVQTRTAWTEGLLEALVRALDSNPGSLDEIDKTIADLREAGVAEDRLPPGWNSIWEPIRQARKELADEA